MPDAGFLSSPHPASIRLAPFRVTSINLKAHSILELPAGQIRNCQTEVGDQLEFV